MKYQSKEAFEAANKFGTGTPNTSYAQFFIGDSFLNPLTAPKGGLFAANVTFEPGCRNNWHIHHATKGGGQLLICTAGEGWYQEEGKPAVSLQDGQRHHDPGRRQALARRQGRQLVQPHRRGSPRRELQKRVVRAGFRRRIRKAVRITGGLMMAVKQTAGRDALGEFAPKFAELNDDVLFGEVWSREDKLSLRDRSLVTVVALMAQGLVDESFRYHLTTAKKNGITKEEIAEVVTHAAFYCGWPKAWAVFRMAKEIWND